jgi:AcrR family transcriptional regulator
MNQMSVGNLLTDAVRPNQRAIAKQRTREKILAAAAELFATRGYEGATIRDIARRAGMSTGAVFASFADKSDLFGEIVAAEQQALEAEMLAAGDAHCDQPVVLAMFNAAAERHMADLALFQATMSAIWTPGLGKSLRRRLRRRPTTVLIAEAVRADLGDAEVDRSFVAELLWDAYISTLRRASLDETPLADVKARLRRQIAHIYAAAARA